MSKRSISPYEKFGVAIPFADAELQIHIFTVTDSITAIAEKYLGDWGAWRLIAERNSIADVRRIEPGTQLIIPNSPLVRGRYESL